MKSEVPLRVMLVGPLSPPQGGMANQTRQLAALLQEGGCDVSLVQVNAPYRPHWVANVPVLRALFRLLPYLYALWCASGRAKVAHVMANSGWSWHLFAAPAILIARMRGVPVLVNYRGGEAGPFLQRQSRWVLPVLRRAQVVAVPSGFLAEVFANYGVAARIVPNVVDLALFNRVERQSKRRPRIVVTRNLEALYDNASALRAFARLRAMLPDAEMVIAGSGREKARLQAEAGRLALSDSVRFVGRLERDEVARLYASADVMLNPSRVDNTPNSILEAWAGGVAVVSTDVGGVPWLVQRDVDALLVPPGDDLAMADALQRVLSVPDLHRRLVSAGRESAQRFSWERVQPVLMATYFELAGESVVTTCGSEQ